MFSSPAPRATPRRRPRESLSISRSNRALSRYADTDAGSVSGITSTSASRHGLARGPLTPSLRSGRLNVLRRGGGSPTSSAGETIRTLRVEGDGLDQAVWARDERLCVSSAGKLPREVQSIVKRTGQCLFIIRWHRRFCCAREDRCLRQLSQMPRNPLLGKSTPSQATLLSVHQRAA